jgi:hypothetical protein
MCASQKPPTLGIIAMFKNEGHIIEEYLRHYRREGVSHFYLIANNSEDSGDKIALAVADDDVTVVYDDRIQKQREAVNDVFQKHVRQSGLDWVMHVDLDEFMWAPNHHSIPNVLAGVSDSVATVRVHWTMFGSSGHIQQPELVVPNFRQRRAAPETFYTKSIDRVDKTDWINVHFSTTRGMEIFDDANLRINHYAIQSWDYFRAVKMTRGDNVHKVNVRDQRYFEKYDWNEVQDDGLFQKHYTAFM